MALAKEPEYIKIPLEEYKRITLDLYTIRHHKHVESKYSHIKCPDATCGLNWWAHIEDSNVIRCVACDHEYNVCSCGVVMTEEEANRSGDPQMCKECRVEFCKDNNMCTECEKDLEEYKPNWWHCKNGCIDPFYKKVDVIGAL